MPGVFQQSVDRITEDAKAAADLGIRAVLLFGIPARKDERASGVTDPKGVIQHAIAAIKKATPGDMSSSPTCAPASTPRTGTVAFLTNGATSTTTERWNCSLRAHSPMLVAASIWSPPRT